jgi:hypothetical protein
MNVRIVTISHNYITFPGQLLLFAIYPQRFRNNIREGKGTEW